MSYYSACVVSVIKTFIHLRGPVSGFGNNIEQSNTQGNRYVLLSLIRQNIWSFLFHEDCFAVTHCVVQKDCKHEQFQ